MKSFLRFLIATVVVALTTTACGTDSQGAVSATQAVPSTSPRPSANPMPSANPTPSAAPKRWTTPAHGDFTTAFDGDPSLPANLDAHIDYHPGASSFFVHLPGNYSSTARYGLVVFVDAGDDEDAEPDGWATVLDQRKLLFIAPLNAGNDQPSPDRLGRAVIAAQQMMRHYPIDPSRVYVSGFSGGARIASQLGFYQPDVFHGTIQNSGTDFYKAVPMVVATTKLSTTGDLYGLLDATPDEINRARGVRFTLITGSEDFRRGNILDIYNGGFAQDGFQAKLFDIPGQSHTTADPATLNAALDFIESSKQ